ncbi:hypothetical protein EDO6_06129 [Paenibacillus xylanexedens]|nr:hypothetical protein EDO6_06129 [Paenibacillus xylanexedens]
MKITCFPFNLELIRQALQKRSMELKKKIKPDNFPGNQT